MRFGFRRPVALVGGRILGEDGEAETMRFDTHILELGAAPKRGDTVIDLGGAFVVPGLINAHDHLELNHYGPLVPRHDYRNAGEWIDELAPRLHQDPEIRSRQQIPLDQRLFAGVLKNLLAGVTLTAHHNPLYTPLRHMPVLQSYRWAHSFGMEGRPVGANGELGALVTHSCRTTPRGVPFFMHAAEGLDAAATAEIERLQEWRCIKPTTVLVHGLGITAPQWRQVVDNGASLVWCPASNQAMFGSTVPVRAFLDDQPGARRHVCLGSDSRLTGSRDLLDELQVAAKTGEVTAGELLAMVTSVAASILKVNDRGQLAPGTRADFVVLPPLRPEGAEALLASRRADLQAVVLGGEPQVVQPRFAPLFEARRTRSGGLTVDGVPKLADRWLLRAIRRSTIAEPGVTVAH